MNIITPEILIITTLGLCVIFTAILALLYLSKPIYKPTKTIIRPGDLCYCNLCKKRVYTIFVRGIKILPDTACEFCGTYDNLTFIKRITRIPEEYRLRVEQVISREKPGHENLLNWYYRELDVFDLTLTSDLDVGGPEYPDGKPHVLVCIQHDPSNSLLIVWKP